MTAPSITGFLLARVTEDESEAPYKSMWIDGCGMVPDDARALAECAAKRAIIEQHHVYALSIGEVQECGVGDGLPCDTLQALAAVYKDHPDYQEEWAL